MDPMALLQEGVPLTLLLDIFGAGPTSAEIYESEPADLTWVRFQGAA
jgi:hypothetical protein